MSADERELAERLAALEAEVKADVDAKAARKREVIAQLRAREAAKQAAAAKPAEPSKALVKRKPRRQDEDGQDDDAAGLEMLTRGVQLAGTAKKELSRPREQGDKSWLASGLLSMFFGPVGWLYAGSFREAIPAGLLYVLVLSLAMKLPLFLIWPVMMVALPISGIAGVVYAIQHNRYGHRMRLFDKDEEHEAAKLPQNPKKRLEPGD